MAATAGDLLKLQTDRLIRSCGRTWPTKGRLIPSRICRSDPSRLATVVLVLNDDAHSHVAIHRVGGPKYPDARVVHLDDDVGTLGTIEIQCIHCRLCGDRVAIQRDDSETMARERQGYGHGRACVQQSEQDSLALANADRLAAPERPLTQNCGVIHPLPTLICRDAP